MIIKTIDLISKPEKNRRETILHLIKYLLNLVFSGIVYTWFFGSFKLIPLDKVNEILNFFLSGFFIKPLLIFIIIWHLFYTVFGWFLAISTISVADVIAKIPKFLESEEGKNPPLIIRILYKILFNLLIQVSFFRYEKKVLITGYSFHKYQKFIVDVKEGEDNIDVNFFIQCFIVTLQFLILLWMLDLMNGNLYWRFNTGVTLIGVFTLIILRYLAGIVLAIQMYSIPIHERMLEMERESKQFLAQLKENKLVETKNEVSEEEKLKDS